MNKYATRLASLEDAIAFIQNMRWFAGMGKIRAERIGKDTVRVTATLHAFSNFCFSRKVR